MFEDKRTKIICTVGPATEDDDVLRDLMRSGMNIARLNFSHGSHEYHRRNIERVRRIASELGKTVAIMTDTKGPEIRTRLNEDGKTISLQAGSTVDITTADVPSTPSCIALDYEPLPDEVGAGDVIFIDDGLIGLEVLDARDGIITCRVTNGGNVGERKGVNIPTVNVGLPSVTEQDKEDIRFSCEMGVDAIAASFVRDAEAIHEIRAFCKEKGLDIYKLVEGIQPICFENAKWAYVCGAAIAIKKGVKTAADAAEAIGIGLQSFCIPGSVADDRKVGLGHGNLAARLLREETECFAFLAGHESFAAAEGAIKIAEMANKVRKKPLRVILNGLGKDAAQIISRINGFTYVQTQFDYFTSELKIVKEIPYGNNPSRLKVKCYGADDVREGVAILWHENVDVSITGNSTNPTRFQHPVAGTYKKERTLAGKPYFSVASGGGTGRTLHPDNMAAGPASYGMTDTMGRMHSDAQFAGSSSVPAHVEMMGFLGMGNNPMVGATVAIAVAIDLALNKK